MSKEQSQSPSSKQPVGAVAAFQDAAIRALVGTTDLDTFEPEVLAKKEDLLKAGRLGSVFKSLTAEAIEAQSSHPDVMVHPSAEVAARVAIRLAFVAALEAEHAKL